MRLGGDGRVDDPGDELAIGTSSPGLLNFTLRLLTPAMEVVWMTRGGRAEEEEGSAGCWSFADASSVLRLRSPLKAAFVAASTSSSYDGAESDSKSSSRSGVVNNPAKSNDPSGVDDSTSA